MTVYLDELFILNLIINYLLLLASAMLCGTHVNRLRVFAGAAAGALYACFVFFPELALFYTLIAKAAFSFLMSLIAYGFGGFRTFIRRTLVFYIVSFAFAGAMLALFKISETNNATVKNGILYASISPLVIIAVSIAAYLLMNLLLKNSPKLSERGTVKSVVTVEMGGKTIHFEAMVDTGNHLSDPLTNARVLVAEYKEVRELISSGARNVLDVIGVGDAAGSLRMLANAGASDGFRLIPYSAIGTKNGLLLAVKPGAVLADGKPVLGALMALTENDLSGETGCFAVIGA